MRFLQTFRQTRKRVKQKATLYSLLVTLLLFGLFLEAYMHNFNLVYITLFFVFSLAFSAGPMGILNIGRLKASIDGSSRLFAKEEGVAFVHIENSDTIPSWAIWLQSKEKKVEVGRIDAISKKRIKLAVVPPKRGMWEIPSCSLQSLFPLATVRFVVDIEKKYKVIVYPTPIGDSLDNFLHRQKANFGEETDFDGVKLSTEAQASSRIHWPSVAKGSPAIKTFIYEKPMQKLRFYFEQAGRSDEIRLSQLTKWVIECEQTRQPFDIVMPSQVLNSQKESINAILEYLARY